MKSLANSELVFCRATVQSIAKDHPVTLWVREDAVLPEFENVTVVRMKLLTHLAPSLHKPYEETVEICKKDGINVAYDGLSLTL